MIPITCKSFFANIWRLLDSSSLTRYEMWKSNMNMFPVLYVETPHNTRQGNVLRVLLLNRHLKEVVYRVDFTSIVITFMLILKVIHQNISWWTVFVAQFFCMMSVVPKGDDLSLTYYDWIIYIPYWEQGKKIWIYKMDHFLFLCYLCQYWCDLATNLLWHSSNIFN